MNGNLLVAVATDTGQVCKIKMKTELSELAVKIVQGVLLN